MFTKNLLVLFTSMLFFTVAKGNDCKILNLATKNIYECKDSDCICVYHINKKHPMCDDAE